MGQRARLALRGFDRAFAEVPGLVEPLKQQAGATHCNVGPAAVTENSTSQGAARPAVPDSAPPSRPRSATSAHAEEAIAHGSPRLVMAGRCFLKPQRQAPATSDYGDQQKEVWLCHTAPEPAEKAPKYVGRKRCGEPDTHQRRE